MIVMADIELRVKGMHCPHCEMRINKALMKVEGVEEVIADHKKGRVLIRFKEGSKVETQKLVDAINATESYTVEKA